MQGDLGKTPADHYGAAVNPEVSVIIQFLNAGELLRDAIKSVAGNGATSWEHVGRLRNLVWKRIGADLLLRAEVEYK